MKRFGYIAAVIAAVGAIFGLVLIGVSYGKAADSYKKAVDYYNNGSYGEAVDSLVYVIDRPLEARRAILEFISSYRDIRRLTMALSAYTGYDLEKCEELYEQAMATCIEAEILIDQYDAAITASENLSQDDKDYRLNKTEVLRAKFKQYQDEFMYKMILAARAGDREMSLETNETIGAVATEIRETSLELHDLVMTTANNFVDEAKNSVKKAENAADEAGKAVAKADSAARFAKHITIVVISTIVIAAVICGVMAANAVRKNKQQ